MLVFAATFLLLFHCYQHQHQQLTQPPATQPLVSSQHPHRHPLFSSFKWRNKTSCRHYISKALTVHIIVTFPYEIVLYNSLQEALWNKSKFCLLTRYSIFTPFIRLG